MLRIGLTGGIGCGKSSVCQLFSTLGVPVLDTDIIAREVVAPGQPGLAALVQAFGHTILHDDGSLDRAALRRHVFASPPERLRLEQLLHPLIRRRLQEQMAQLHAAYVIIVIPLLLEKGWQAEVDRILVIDCDEQQQLERTLLRDQGVADTVQQIIASQVSRRERLAAADDVINNEGTPAALAPQVERLHHLYLQLPHGE